MNLTLLKTAMHLGLYAVNHQLWNHAFFWHGTCVTISRFLKLGDYDKIKMKRSSFEDPVDGNIIHEESRRCFWYVRESDISGSAASKRHHFFECQDEWNELLLPVSQNVFYYGNPATFQPTINIKQFLDPQLNIDWNIHLGPNAFLMVLESIYARITSFRRRSESMSIKVFDTSQGQLVQDYQLIRNDLVLFYHRLPDAVKQFDNGMFPIQWDTECSEWIILKIIYHSTFASLHGI